MVWAIKLAAKNSGFFPVIAHLTPGAVHPGKSPIYKEFPLNSMTYLNVYKGRLPIPIKRSKLGVVAYAGLHAFEHNVMPADRSSCRLAQLYVGLPAAAFFIQ